MLQSNQWYLQHLMILFSLFSSNKVWKKFLPAKQAWFIQKIMSSTKKSHLWADLNRTGNKMYVA